MIIIKKIKIFNNLISINCEGYKQWAKNQNK